MPRRRRRSNPGRKTRSRSQSLGALYRGASTTAIIASPAAVQIGAGARTPQNLLLKYRSEAKPFAIGMAVHLADQVIGQKVFGHNSALGRRSVTAWIPEAIATVHAAQEGARGGAGYGTAQYSVNKTSYNPSTTANEFSSPVFQSYIVSKVIGGVVRKVSGMGAFARVTAPVKRILGSLGGAL